MRGWPFEGVAAAEQLVHRDRQGVLVHAPVIGIAEEQLRGHVLRRADHLSCLRKDRLGFLSGIPCCDLGDAEVTQVHVAMHVEEDVTRLDIPVDVVLPVDEVQSGRHFPQPDAQLLNRRGPRPAVGPSLMTILQAAAAEVLQDGEGNIVVLADIGNLDDMGMDKAHQRADFVQEAAGKPFVDEHGLPGDFNDCITVEVMVTGAVDIGHAALAQHFLNDVAAVGKNLVDPISGVRYHGGYSRHRCSMQA
jgi:hypothetical protein